MTLELDIGLEGILRATWLPTVLTMAARCHLGVLRQQQAQAFQRWLKACEDGPAEWGVPVNERLRWLLHTVHLRRWEQVRASANLTAICALLLTGALVGAAIRLGRSIFGAASVTSGQVALCLLAGVAVAVLLEALLIRRRLPADRGWIAERFRRPGRHPEDLAR